MDAGCFRYDAGERAPYYGDRQEPPSSPEGKPMTSVLLPVAHPAGDAQRPDISQPKATVGSGGEAPDVE